jgi:peptide/nickel transport system permease protein
LNLVVYVVLGLVLLAALIGPIIAPADVDTSNILIALQPPSREHWFGTDQQGRDVFWRVVVGARPSVFSSVIIVVGFSALGTLVATIATASGRVVDEIVMRIVDSVMAIPPIIFALGVAAALGPSLQSAVIAMTLTGWPYTARLLRGIMRETAEATYVEGARVLGASQARIMLKHVLPNSLGVMVVKWAGDMGNTILVLGALSFVGVGAQPPSAEWGAAITAAKGDLSVAWWPAFFPGIAIAITAIAFGLLGDSLQRHFNADLV